MHVASLRSPSPSPSFHPEAERLLAAVCWTSDPAVAVLAAAIRALLSVGEQLRNLSADRPAIDHLIADEIGALQSVPVETGRVNVWHRDYRPSGAIALIWSELDALRHRWIAARLAAEGLDRVAVDITLWYNRLQQLEDDAPTLAEWWTAQASRRD
ncbi:MAG TPA: hypothetical protein VF409_08940 [Sphingomonas sp.]